MYGANGEGWARISLVTKTERMKEALERLEKLMA
jgi:aspartate/methionine/tyrosine aminotransferase